MSGAYRPQSGPFVFAVGMGALALAACTSGNPRPAHMTGSGAAGTGLSPNPDTTGAAGSGAAGTGMVVVPPGTGAAGTTVIPDDPNKTSAPPLATCNAALPPTFVTICSGCH